jgi:hypothetical protein
MPEFFRGYGEVLSKGDSRVTLAFAVAAGVALLLLAVFLFGGVVRGLSRVFGRRRQKGAKSRSRGGSEHAH